MTSIVLGLFLYKENLIPYILPFPHLNLRGNLSFSFGVTEFDR